MLQEQLEVFFFLSANILLNNSSVSRGWRDWPRLSTWGQCVAQALERRDSKERIITGVQQARKTSWESWVLCWASKKSPSLGWAEEDKE